MGAAGGLLLAYPPSIFECDAVINSSRAIHAEIMLVGCSHYVGYSMTACLASLLGRRFNPPLNPICILRYVSIACGIAGAYVFYRVLLHLYRIPSRAALASGTLLFSYAYWHYMRQADSHVAAALMLAVFLWSVQRFLSSPTASGGIMSGLTLGGATLMHISNVLLLPVVIVSCAFVTNTRISVWGALAGLLTAFFSITVLPATIIARSVAKVDSIGQLWQWVYGSGSWGNWGNWSWHNPMATTIGIVRSLTASHYLLKLDSVSSWARQFFPAASLEDELAISAVTPGALFGPLLILNGIVLVTALTMAVNGLTRFRRLLRRDRPFAVFLILWVIVYGVFFAWWAPERTEFWIGWFIPCLAIAALPSRARTSYHRTRRAFGGIALLGSLVFVNFFGSIYPQSGRLSEVDTDVGLAIDAAIGWGDIIISDCSFSGRASRYLRSFEKVNLLDSCTGGFGPAGPRMLYRSDRSIQDHHEHIVHQSASRQIDPLAITKAKYQVVGIVDSIMTEAELRHKVVYLITEPLSTEPRRAAIYNTLVQVIAQHYDISHSVPLRHDIDLRTVERRL